MSPKMVWEDVNEATPAEGNYLAASEMEDGDNVEGTLVRILTRESQFENADGSKKTMYTLEIDRNTGEKVFLTASGTLANKTLRFGLIKEGDYILITRRGFNEFKTKKGKAVKEGNFEVKRRTAEATKVS